MSKKPSVRVLTFTAMMIALSVVFERLLPLIDMRELRVSLGNVPVYIVGCGISPLYGASAGLIADLVGCVIKGYAPNPFLMAAPFIVGFLPYFLMKLFSKVFKDKLLICVILAVLITNALAGGLVTTVALCYMYGTPFAVLFVSRILTVAANTFLDILCVYFVLSNSTVSRQISRIGGKKQ